jgi:putative phosphoesterase
MRIGLISDTHVPVAMDYLWPQVYDAFRGVDLIMHGGDLMVPDVIDWLEEIAPVMAVQGNGDYTGWERSVAPTDPRLSEAKVLAVDLPHGRTLRIGLVHDFQLPEAPPLRTVHEQMRHYFREPVNVIVRGSTHRAEVLTVKGVLIVNPGSPTFPNHQSTRLGTVAGGTELQLWPPVARPAVRRRAPLPPATLPPPNPRQYNRGSHRGGRRFTLDTSSHQLRDILVPVSGTPAGYEALSLACNLSKRGKGKVYAVYVIEVARTLALDAEMVPEAQAAEEVLVRAEEIGDQLDCKLEGEILQARDAGHAIVDEAIERNVSAIFLGVGYEKPLGEFELGQTARYVVEHAPCQVILLRAAVQE